MKRNLTVGLIALAIPVITVIGFSVFNRPTPKPKKLHTEDMPTLVQQIKSMQIEFVDSVDGRPTYNVTFPDSTGLDSMYPEEIAHGLITGKWDYNEDFEIKERDTK